MSKKTGSTYTLQEILALTDEELTTNWSRLGSLIRLYEEKEWKDAKTLAIDLFKEDRAMDYVQSVRDEVANERKKNSTPTIPKKSKKPKESKKAKVVPINSKRDRFSMNYKRLTDLIPDLISRLENGEEIYGKATNTGYMDLNIEFLDRDKKGYYLSLTHYYTQDGDLVPDPDMEIFVDLKNQVVLALSFQNAYYYRPVYDDKYKRTLTNTKEESTQNSFLKTWLENIKNQGHEIEWTHDQDEEQEQKKVRKPKKPDVSFIPKVLRESLESTINKITIDEVIQSYDDHKNGTIHLNPISLFFIVERINESTSGQTLPYPQKKKIMEYFDSLKPEGYDETILGLNKEVEKTKVPVPKFDPSVFLDNYKLLLKIAPNLNKQLDKYGTDIHGRSINDKLLYDLVLKAPEKTADGYEIILVEARETLQKKVIDEHFAMGIHFSPKKKEVRALLIYLANGEVENVYPRNEDDIFDQDARLIEQNKALNSWLTELSKSGHLIEWLNEESEVIDEYNKEVPKNEDTEETVKHWEKLAAFIEKAENLSPEKAKEKALKLKKEGKGIDYIEQAYRRKDKSSLNHILKLNYQKLMRLMPELFSLKEKESREFKSPNKQSRPFIITYAQKSGKFTNNFSIVDSTNDKIRLLFKVQRNSKKVWVIERSGKFTSHPDFKAENNQDEKLIENVNKQFGKSLDIFLKNNYQLIQVTEEKEKHLILLEKFPIVIEFSEGSRTDKNIGLQSLQDLQDRLKTYKVPPKGKGYAKTYVWFKGYKHGIRIDLSETKGDFNPNQSKQSLEDWLTEYDPKFDWGQFSSKKEIKKKNIKHLQKEVDEIPDFEIGKVEWTKQHKKHGITKKQIAWINKHKQGLIITPLGKSKTRILGNTKDIISDFNKQAMPFGKRLSRTGKIYYETRSNRADVTKKGL